MHNNAQFIISIVRIGTLNLKLRYKVQTNFVGHTDSNLANLEATVEVG